MKTLLLAGLLLAGLAASAQAQEEADAKYLGIYGALQQADKLAESGEPHSALAAYAEVQTQLQRFRKLYPDWNPNIINYRLNDVGNKIAGLQPPVSRPVAETSPAQPVSAQDAKLQAELNALQSQIQAAQSENASLQAKLKEALATQPAMIDATELLRAQEQIRSLMKENDLLKTTRARVPEKIVVTDTNEISNLRQQLSDSVKKLTGEHDRAQRLVAENASLQKDLARLAQNGGQGAGSLELLRSENERLKTQLVALQVAMKDAAAAEELAAKLKEARQKIIALQSAAAISAVEKGALENKVRKLSTELAAMRAANYEGRIRDLTEQQKDLTDKLAAAKKKSPGQTDVKAAAQLAALNEEVKSLRSRVAVDESKPVPYTAEELALFRQPTPAPVKEQPTRKSIRELPAGTVELAVSAQQHFAKGEFDEAGADYRKILARDQNNGLALANLATIELQQDKLDDAEKHITAALAQSPDDAYNLSTLGYLKFRQEKYDDALNALSRAAAIDPNNPEIQNYLGVTLSHKGQRMQAETALRKAIRLNPLYAPAHNNLAVIYLNQQPPVPLLARWHYQKALAAGQPRNPELEKALADKGAPVDAP